MTPPRRARRRRRRLLVGLGIAVVVVAGAAAVLVATRSGGGRPSPAAVRAAAPSTRRSTSTTTSVPGPTTTTTTVDPGALPQTPEQPSAAGFVLGGHVQLLWDAVVADDPARAMPFFFPLTAYEQVKNISDPEHDWRTRLVANFEQDVHAWHARLGPGATSAQLLGLSVPTDQARWIVPGVEYNKGSYWRVYGSQLRYQLDGRVSSFTVASMISWRGEWYVVHLASIR